jgi:hypothetical protein
VKTVRKSVVQGRPEEKMFLIFERLKCNQLDPHSTSRLEHRPVAAFSETTWTLSDCFGALEIKPRPGMELGKRLLANGVRCISLWASFRLEQASASSTYD